MGISQSATAVENDHGRNGGHTVGATQFTTEFAKQIHTHNSRLSLQVFFNPIHDGLCDEASGSSIRKEISDHGLPAFDHCVERILGIELRCARSQKKEPEPDQQQKYD